MTWPETGKAASSTRGSSRGEENMTSIRIGTCTGAYLLAYGLPLKSLYVTGKKTVLGAGR